MKRLIISLCMIAPMALSAQNLTPKQHPKKETYGYWGEKKNGKEDFVIKPQFEKAGKFVNNHALVCKKGVWCIISNEGKTISQTQYSNVDLEALNQQHFRVWQGAQCGLVDLKSTQEIFKVKYNYIESWKLGIYKLYADDHEGLANLNGEEILPTSYDKISSEKQGGYLLERDGKYGLASNEGREIFPVNYEEIRAWKQGGYMLKLNGKFGLSDVKGKEILPVKYDNIKSWRQGGYLLKVNGKYGLADATGKEFLQPNYDAIGIWKQGGYLLKVNGKYGLANAEGKEILKVQYDDIMAWTQNRLLLRSGDKYNLIDNSGNEICKDVCHIGNNIYAFVTDSWSFANELGEPVNYSDRAIFYNTNDDNALSKAMGANLHLFSNGKGVLLFPAPPMEIGSWTFEDCTSLTSITVPNSVTNIGSGAFKNCTSLTSITIPNSVATIEYNAFENCTALTSVTIPNSVTKIGGTAFKNCTSLTNITIPDSVATIEYNAFENCTALTSVTIPDSVTEIGEGAFMGCTKLSAFYGKFVSSDNRCLIVNDVLIGFAGTGVKSYAISSSVMRIGCGAFYGCAALASIKIPDSVTEIGVDAFSGCTALPVIGGLIYADNCLVGGINEKRQIHKIRQGTRLIAAGALDGAPVVNLVIPASVTVINGEFYDHGFVTVEFQGQLYLTEFTACTSLKKVTHMGVPIEFSIGWK